MSEKIKEISNYELRKKYGLEKGFGDGHVVPGFVSRVYRLQDPYKETAIGETTVKIIEWQGKFIVAKYNRKTEDDFSMELRIDIKDNKGFGNLAFIQDGFSRRYIEKISSGQLDFILEVIDALETKESEVERELLEALEG